ncbi:MAG: FAD-dependent oxidoreductase, partial [Fluviicola sp.]
MKHIVIIGHGIAGITAAREIRKQSDFKITVISKESKYFFSRTALMYVYMGHMPFENLQPYENDFWAKNRIDLIHDEVISVDKENRIVNLKQSSELKYDELIFATGSTTAYYNWPGQEFKGV